ALDAALCGGLVGGFALRRRQFAGHDDLFAVDGDVGCADEPVAGQASREPGSGVVGRREVGLLPAARAAEPTSASAHAVATVSAVPVRAAAAVASFGATGEISCGLHSTSPYMLAVITRLHRNQLQPPSICSVAGTGPRSETARRGPRAQLKTASQMAM